MRRFVLRMLLLTLVVFFATPAVEGFFDPPECDLSGFPDCWICKKVRFNPEFCWTLVGSENQTGQCGCADFAPYGGCVTAGNFCGIIWVTP